MDKKKLILWSLYDFANSIAVVVFFLYYSQWLVVEKGVSDLWFNMTFAAGSILLVLTAPVAAAIADKTKRRLGGLRLTTMGTFISLFLTGLVVLKWPDHYIVSMILFTLGTFFYQFCFSYYNPMLEDVASRGQQGTASGWGQFGNWIGQIVGLLVTLPIARGTWHIFEGSARAQTLIPAAVLFMLFSLPLLIFFKEKQTQVPVAIDLKAEYRDIIPASRKLLKLPAVGIFLLAFFFFNDAIITASNNFPIYIQKVFAADDTLKTFLLVGILITAAIGAPLSGWISDRFGLKKALMIILAGWIVLFPALGLATNFTVFFFVAMVMGLWFGSIWTVTRAMLLELVPKPYVNQTFTFYTLMERFATLIGPLSWGMLVAFGPHAGGLNYRLAATSMAIFVFIGFLIARKLPEHGSHH